MCDRRVGISGGAYTEVILILEFTVARIREQNFYIHFGFGKSARTALVTAEDM